MLFGAIFRSSASVAPRDRRHPRSDLTGRWRPVISGGPLHHPCIRSTSACGPSNRMLSADRAEGARSAVEGQQLVRGVRLLELLAPKFVVTEELAAGRSEGRGRGRRPM